MRQGEKGRGTLIGPRIQDVWGEEKHTKGQKGWYREQPQTAEAAQVLVTKPDFHKARIPVLKSLLNNPTQEGDVVPLGTPPIFFKSPDRNSIGQRFPPIPLFLILFPIRLRRPRHLLRTHLREREENECSIPHTAT